MDGVVADPVRNEKAPLDLDWVDSVAGFLWKSSTAMWLVKGGHFSPWNVPREVMIPASVVS